MDQGGPGWIVVDHGWVRWVRVDNGGSIVMVDRGGSYGGGALGVGLLDVLEQRPNPVHDALVALGVPVERCVVNISK